MQKQMPDSRRNSNKMPLTLTLSRPTGYVFTVVSRCAAAAILAAVEGGILPPGTVSLSEELTAKPNRETEHGEAA